MLFHGIICLILNVHKMMITSPEFKKNNFKELNIPHRNLPL